MHFLITIAAGCAFPKNIIATAGAVTQAHAGHKPVVGEEKGKGMLQTDVPLAAFSENFSSMDFIDPPPLGKLICGADAEE
jgi:hypothetical protein